MENMSKQQTQKRLQTESQGDGGNSAVARCTLLCSILDNDLG
jgi:hypothetical protein